MRFFDFGKRASAPHKGSGACGLYRDRDVAKGPCLVTLDPDSEEYDDVKQMFDASSCLENVRIKRIAKVHNPGLTERYRALRKTMPGSEEAWLFHGTTTNCVDSIASQGFNRSYAVDGSTLFGRGVYFSHDATGCLAWSAIREFFLDQAWDKSTAWAAQNVFLARMLVGNVIVGSENQFAPPEGFHTFVDSAFDPIEYVATQDAQAIPEYLITTEDERIAEAEIAIRKRCGAILRGEEDSCMMMLTIGPIMQLTAACFIRANPPAAVPPPPSFSPYSYAHPADLAHFAYPQYLAQPPPSAQPFANAWFPPALVLSPAAPQIFAQHPAPAPPTPLVLVAAPLLAAPTLRSAQVWAPQEPFPPWGAFVKGAPLVRQPVPALPLQQPRAFCV